MSLPNPKKRIESIDVLRAFILLGILSVHANDGFALFQTLPAEGFSKDFHNLIRAVLSGKCNIAFNILFGVSFALILRNHKSSSLKFIWRCILLIGFGVINKIFFWYDALMLYGIIGIVITPFRYLSSKTLIILATIAYLFSIFILPDLHPEHIVFGDWTPSSPPHNPSFKYIITRPVSEGIKTYFYVVIKSCGIPRCFSFCLLGYVLGRTSGLYHLSNYIKSRWLTMLWCLTLISFCWRFLTPDAGILGRVKIVDNLIACVTYCYTILFIFYRWKRIRRYMLLLAPYGKLGLTNYSLQATLGVLFFTIAGTTLIDATPLVLTSYILLFFSSQAVFSYYWMKYMQYGPLEWIWRSATNLRFIPLKQVSKIKRSHILK